MTGMTDGYKIVLASKSPRRSEILKNAGFDFTVRTQDADETLPDGISPEEAVMLLAERKAKAVERKENEIVLGADTVVVLEEKILGKPTSEETAFEMLKSLSGRTHSVYTGVFAILNDGARKFCVKTDVEFLEISDREIEEYISTEEPFDKAGAYGIQGFASKFVKRINGDYFNVVGLPVSTIYENILKYLKN